MTNTTKSCMDDFDPDSLDIDQARSKILEAIKVISESETIGLTDAIGRVTAKDISTTIDVPGFRNSAMDGYAFRHKDSFNTKIFNIIGTSLAGHPYTGTLETNQCVKITTGAAIPDGADTVIMQENTIARDLQVTIDLPPALGTNVRAQGSNIQRDTVLIKKHSQIGAAELGLIASVGQTHIDVLRKLRVACFSTGDELTEPAEPLRPGMIHDSNRYMLLGLLQNPAIESVDVGIQPDNREALKTCIGGLSDVDVILSSGGVSVGEADFVKDVLTEYGQINFWKIAMKPGRPLTHAMTNSGAQFFGLPGNPVSGIVTFHHFVLPALNAMLGQAYQPPISLKARLTESLVKQPGRIEMQRGILSQDQSGEWAVASTGFQDSHVLTSMHRANCYIVLDMASTGALAGEYATTVPFSNF